MLCKSLEVVLDWQWIGTKSRIFWQHATNPILLTVIKLSFQKFRAKRQGSWSPNYIVLHTIIPFPYQVLFKNATYFCHIVMVTFTVRGSTAEKLCILGNGGICLTHSPSQTSNKSKPAILALVSDLSRTEHRKGYYYPERFYVSTEIRKYRRGAQHPMEFMYHNNLRSGFSVNSINRDSE
jgi:hypothetical protein